MTTYCLICEREFQMYDDVVFCDCCEFTYHAQECKDRHDFIVKAHAYPIKVAVNNTTSARVSCRICGREAGCPTEHGEEAF